jgi:hypothetical protein
MENDNNKYVVIKDGQRATGLLTQEAAEAQAAKIRQQINEQSGQPVKESNVQVKQHLCG